MIKILKKHILGWGLLAMILVFGSSGTSVSAYTQTGTRTSTSDAGIAETYATASDGTPLNWNVYTPTGNGPWPAVLVIHGGGFKLEEENSSQTRQAAVDLAAHGYIVFRIDYRLAPPGHVPGQTSGGHYPDQTDDVKLAVLAARNDSRSNGEVGAVGGSAGGSHTAFVTADGVKGKDKVDVGVSLSGAYDFSDTISQTVNPNFKTDVENYVNSSDPIALLDASPISKINSTISPFFMVETENDPMPTNQFTVMKAKLDALGIKTYQSTILPGGAHSFANWPVIKDQAMAFLDSVLMGNPKPIASGGGNGTRIPVPPTPVPLPSPVPPSDGCLSGYKYSPTTGLQCPVVITASNYVFYRDLTLGYTGEDVLALQKFLNANGNYVAVSGTGSIGFETNYFGILTQSALVRYQATHGITPALGYFGPITRSFILTH